MSIRLRLTLIYTAILVLTLALFGGALYVSQDRRTLSIVEQDLRDTSGKMIVAWTRFHATAPRALPWSLARPGDRVAVAPEDIGRYGAGAWQALRLTVQGAEARDVVVLLDPEGNPMPRAGDSDAATVFFPISDNGMRAIAAGRGSVEITDDDGVRWLTLSRPVVLNDTDIGILQIARPLADRDRAIHALRVTLTTEIALVSILAFGAGWALSGAALRPIQRITETAEQIGETQDLSARVEHRGPNDEVGKLAKTFNGMLARLDAAYQQIEHALQVQRDFVADVSHELRTPLTTIRGNLALLQRTPAPPDAVSADIIGDLAEESARLSRMVTDLLALARADAGQQLPVQPLSIGDIAADVCRQTRVLAPDRVITCECPEGIAAAANPDALKQTLLILMDNAITHGQGEIRLEVVESDAGVTIRVQDSGPGMDEALQDRIFDRFYRGDASRSTPGFGLGLSIAKSLVEAQGGTIVGTSEVGVGSTFTVTLPATEI